jgi:hypothetical protein
MCQLCAIAVRYSRVRQDSLVFDRSQFAAAVAKSPSTEQSQNQLKIQEKPS